MPVGSVYGILVYGDTYSDQYAYERYTATGTIANDPPYDLEGEYPESKGLNWSDNYPNQQIFNAGGEDLTDTWNYKADGAYTFEETFSYRSYSEMTKAVIASNGKVTAKTSTSTGSKKSLTIGLPFQRRSVYLIPVKQHGKTTDVPNWYPGGAAAPSPLSSLSYAIVGYKKTPKACGAQAKQQAYDVQSTSFLFDPFQRNYSYGTLDAFDSPTLGFICSIYVVSGWQYDVLTGAILDHGGSTTVTLLTSASGTRGRNTGRAPLQWPDYRRNLNTTPQPRLQPLPG